MKYTFQGQYFEEAVEPDLIDVVALPELTMDYFLERDIRADDPFTQPIEPPEPFTLGVRIRNDGFGTSRRTRIDTAQPKIVDNKQGLLIGFQIILGFIDDEPASPNLLLDFGEIPPGRSRAGRWNMETNLAGEFVEFSASVAHSDELGGELTSIIRGARTHSLIRDVRVDLPGRDTVRDFLAADDDAIRVYESDSIDTVVSNQSDVATLTLDHTEGGDDVYTLTAPPTGGFLYVKLTDPAAGQREIRRALRFDGKSIPPENVWLQTSGTGSETTHSLNLFDVNGGGTYRIELGAITLGEVPPVLQFIPDRTTAEGQQIGFLVEASDPNGTVPRLSVAALPVGATFEDEGDGVGFFHWIPVVGQAGSYPVTFKASDGIFTASRTATIRVLGEGVGGGDVDGDGLDDEWERRFFGGTERDGAGDFDSDGVSDHDEFVRGSDPTFAGIGSVPVIANPAVGGEVGVLRPELSVHDSVHGQTVVSYEFELYADEELRALVASASGVEEGDSVTAWTPGVDLLENALYFWRARLVDAGSPTDWVLGSFRVNTANDPPSPPLLTFPAVDSIVTTTTPILESTTGTDPEDDQITYDLAIYADEALANRLLFFQGIQPVSDGLVSLTLPVPLAEGRQYWWQVLAVDEHGASSPSAVGHFHVDLRNSAPTAPLVLSPALDARVNSATFDLVVTNAVDPETDPLTYVFELDTVPTFDGSGRRVFGPVSPGPGETRVAVTGLVEDADHFWRVKANDGHADGPWAYGQFFVSALDSPPGVPRPLSPGDGAVVELASARLVVSAVEDPDRDLASYEFEVYRDADLQDRVTTGGSLTPDWVVEPPLESGNTYRWHARAKDARGEPGGWSEPSSFTIVRDVADDPPTIELIEPDHALVVAGGIVRIRWVDADPDSNATITLLVNGVPIAEGIAEDPDAEGDVFEWAAGSFEPGEYTISARITDASSTATADACCPVTILPAQSGVTAELVGKPLLDEWGVAEARVHVVLDSAPLPGATVAVPIVVSDAGEARILGETQLLTFTSETWSVPQEVGVRGVDDCDVDGDQTVLLQIGPALSTDPRFSGKRAPDVTLINTDNEFAGQTLFVCEYEEVTHRTEPESGVVEAEYRAILNNRGTDARAAFARLDSRSAEIAIVGDPTIEFPLVPPGGRAGSLDTFTVRYPASGSLDRAKLQWTITSTIPGMNPPQDAYLCYGANVRDGQPPFEKRDKRLRDEFGFAPETFQIARPTSLCTAPTVNGAAPLNAAVGQAGYAVRRKAGSPRFEPRIVTTRDRFGEKLIEVRDPVGILEPTSFAKLGGAQPQPPSNNQGGTDRFKCYEARTVGVPVAAGVTVRVVDDILSQGKQFELVQLIRLCAPMDKEGETPTAPEHTVHLACYRARPRAAGPPFSKTFVSTNNSNFGAGVWTLSSPDEICVPALEDLGTSAPPVVCGDGFREGPEQCDDGNRVSGDGCGEGCTLSGRP